MNTNRNTDQLFQHMRNAPVDVPLENVEKFVIAQAALGITAVGVSKGIFTKAFFKLHLNSILIMTTTFAAAALVSIFAWTSDGDKIAAKNNPETNFEFSANALVPDMETASDTPRTTTTRTITNGEETTVTTIQTETGTNIRVITIDNGTKVYYNTPNDSSYVFAYESTDAPSLPPLPALPPLPNVNPLKPLPAMPPLPPNTPMGCCGYDSLTALLGKELYKDGLIKDSVRFAFKMNGTSLWVNGKKQPKEKWEKYKTIIEKNSDYRIHHLFDFSTGMNGVGDSFGTFGMLDPMEPMAPMPPMEPVSFCYNFKTCTDTLMPRLEKSLMNDGLIKDTLHYTFKINGSYMKVNGEKVSKEVWKKYKDLIESNSQNKVNRSFSYAISKDGEDISINMQNFVN
jgi:hypothetical protein